MAGLFDALQGPRSEEQWRYQDRRKQVSRDHEASQPHEQYRVQVSEEEIRVWFEEMKGTQPIPVGSDPRTIAYETVKEALARARHLEQQMEHSEPATDSETEPSPPIFSFFPDDEKRQTAERRVVREREREASRPYHQFVYQVSKERERIQQESENEEGVDAADINTRAYENIKDKWTGRGIWHKRWGVLPGMSWKHELPFEELVREEMVDDPIPVSPLVNSSHEVAEVRLFGSPSPVQSNDHQVSSALNSSQQGPPADTDLAGSDNGDAECSPSAPISPRPSLGKRVLRHTTGKVFLPKKRKVSHKRGQLINALLGQVHPSRVSKAAGKRKRSQRQLNISQNISSNGLPLPSDVHTSKPPSSPHNHVASTRSTQIQPHIPAVFEDPTRMAFTNPSKRPVTSKPERIVARDLRARSSAIPRGILKKQPAKVTRGRATKNRYLTESVYFKRPPQCPPDGEES